MILSEFHEILTGLCPFFDFTNIALLLVVKLENGLSWELEILYVASVQKTSEYVFFFSVSPCMAKLCPFFDSAVKIFVNTMT